MRTESVRTIAPFWGGKSCGVGVILQKYGDFGIAVPQGKKC